MCGKTVKILFLTLIPTSIIFLGFQLINLNSNNQLDEFLSSYNEESGNTLAPESLRSKVVLIHDAIFMLYQAVSKINIKSVIVKPKSLDCEKYESWIYGSTLLNVMKTVCFLNIIILNS